jgi:hypothetical protein
MAEAALKEEIMPEGGIADFIRTDEEIAAMDAEDAKKEFGESGIANFQETAAKMASYGRFGDDMVVHVEKGELVVPRALIEDNPELKESIFNHLREQGIEDPERYVVGSSANSINPETGIPEFFLKKIFKGVSKSLKKVGKVLKKAAPLILPIILGPAGLGLNAIYAGALGAGLGTLIQGGSMKDAVKAGLLGGATGAVFTGFSGSGSFGENISGAFTNPVVEGSYLAGIGAPAQTAVSNVPPGSAAQTMSASTSTPTVTGATDYLGTGATDYLNTVTGTSQITPPPYEPSTFTGSIAEGNFKEAFFPTGPTTAQVAQAQGSAYTEAYNAALGAGSTQAAAEAAGQAALKNVTAQSMGPNLLRKYGPLAAAGTGIAAAGGFFTAPEEEEATLTKGPTGAELLAQDPEKYTPKGYDLTVAQGPYSRPTSYQYSPVYKELPNPFGIQYAEEGGEIFPRRVGGIMPNEGIPGKDSVKAMLMPGEFVMTTDAVKGLGNGSLNNGIQNMYQMMRGLEAKGKAMA